jgi:hypothetical protein
MTENYFHISYNIFNYPGTNTFLDAKDLPVKKHNNGLGREN